MGVAYVVQGANFAPANLGKVTQVGDVPVEAIAILGPASVVGNSDAATFLAAFVPINTTERSISWSIVDGATYASIDSSSGVLSVLTGASSNNVTIRATSVNNPAITADKQILVTYSAAPGPDPGYTPLEDLTARVNSNSSGHYVTDIVLDATDKIKFKFTQFGGSQGGVFFGSRTAGNADDNATMLEFGSFGIGYRGIKLRIAGKYHYSGQAMASSTIYLVEGDASDLTISPSLGSSVAGSDYTFNEALPIAIMGLYLANGTVTDRPSMDFYGLEIYSQNGFLKHRLIPQPDLTLLDEVTNATYQPVGTLIYTAE